MKPKRMNIIHNITAPVEPLRDKPQSGSLHVLVQGIIQDEAATPVRERAQGRVTARGSQEVQRGRSKVNTLDRSNRRAGPGRRKHTDP